MEQSDFWTIAEQTQKYIARNYAAALADERQMLKAEAAKAPKKVRRLSMALLICFMLIYIVVIGSVLMNSLGGLLTW